MKDHEQLLKWQRIKTLSEENYRVFTVTRVNASHAGSNREGVFSIIKSPDWVNVLAITKDDQAVMIRQFRHGTQATTTEIPGGMVDPGESPLSAAKRELSEETGYTSVRWICLGVAEPNPAIQENLCHMFLALDAELTHERDLDPNEVIDVHLTALEQLPSMVYSGEIRHSLVLACFGYFMQLTGGWQRPTPEQLAAWHPTLTERRRSSEASDLE